MSLHKIMVVEDEEDIQKILQLSLQQIAGFNVKTCSSGDELLQEIDEFQPDLVLLDVMMEGMDGPSTLKKLREIGNTTPCIFLTAKSLPHEIEEFTQMGAIGVLSKPFNLAELPEDIKKIWASKI
ncbi:response regulator [Candidatus Uabimicrobium amorphum]|uniref:Response regulator n=1 Tax=Uabimicrobium amorphum TaxID=2596890 RepID=A0A5S9F2G5_UABAM|nr:response regulator [Candidatus Uabimicrobium amorphum]BBM83408.1 response regulator [Candidatus Uabimicrobium amorphum]